MTNHILSYLESLGFSTSLFLKNFDTLKLFSSVDKYLVDLERMTIRSHKIALQNFKATFYDMQNFTLRYKELNPKYFEKEISNLFDESNPNQYYSKKGNKMTREGLMKLESLENQRQSFSEIYYAFEDSYYKLFEFAIRNFPNFEKSETHVKAAKQFLPRSHWIHNLENSYVSHSESNIRNPKNFDELFLYPELIPDCIDALRKVEPPIITNSYSYNLGGRQKGAFAAWIAALKTKGLIKNYCQDSTIAELLNNKFNNLNLGKDGRTLRNLGTSAYYRYYSDLLNLLPELPLSTQGK